MLALDPDSPVHHFALGEALGSLGPAFAPDKARQHLQRFLDLTGEAMFVERWDGAPQLDRDELAYQLATFPLLTRAEGLDALRIEAKQLLADLWVQKGKPQPLLLMPDRKELAATTAKLERGHARKAGEQRDLEGKLSGYTTQYEAVYQQYEQAKKNRRRAADLQPYVDQLAALDGAIQRTKKRLEPLQQETAAMQDRLTKSRMRLLVFVDR
jgi:DNA repair exonuclease SbcCD ATPase subunit